MRYDYRECPVCGSRHDLPLVPCEGFREELARLAKRPWGAPEVRILTNYEGIYQLMVKLFSVVYAAHASPSETPAPGHPKPSPSPPE